MSEEFDPDNLAAAGLSAELLVEADRLRKRFGLDSIQILVTTYNPDRDSTRYYSAGRGNFFARVGHCRDFLERIKDGNLGNQERD